MDYERIGFTTVTDPREKYEKLTAGRLKQRVLFVDNSTREKYEKLTEGRLKQRALFVDHPTRKKGTKLKVKKFETQYPVCYRFIFQIYDISEISNIPRETHAIIVHSLQRNESFRLSS